MRHIINNGRRDIACSPVRASLNNSRFRRWRDPVIVGPPFEAEPAALQ